MVAKMTQSPVEIDFKGRTYVFHPLRDKDYAEYEQWCHNRIVQLALEQTKNLPEELRAKTLAYVIERAALVTFSSQESKTLLSSVEGAVKLAYLSLKRGQPDVQLEEVREMCTDPEFIVKVFETIASLAITIPSKPNGVKKKAGKSNVKRSTKSSQGSTGGRRNKSRK